MEAEEVVRAIETTTEPTIPDNAEVKVITPLGQKSRILSAFYKAEENVLYLGIDFPETRES